MNSSFKIFSVRGIDIRLHITFPLILIWAAYQFGFAAGTGWPGALFGVAAVSFLFGLVTLHELGHSFAALHYGIPVKQIVLLPIGGVAQLKEIPEKPLQELVIALAGPAVNVVVALLMGGVAWILNLGTADIMAAIFGGGSTLLALFSYIFVYNIFLAVFNLIPAFPLDGGRVLRAVLAIRLEYGQATAIAATLGRGLAMLFGLYGLMSGQFSLILIAIFIYFGAGQERRVSQVRRLLRGYTVRQAYSQHVNILSPHDTLETAVSLRLNGVQSNFPVVQNGQVVGILTEDRLNEALKHTAPTTFVGYIMEQDVRPVSLTNDLYDVQQRLMSENVSALPVVEDSRFLGFITGQAIQQIYRLLSSRPDIDIQPSSA